MVAVRLPHHCRCLVAAVLLIGNAAAWAGRPTTAPADDRPTVDVRRADPAAIPSMTADADDPAWANATTLPALLPAIAQKPHPADVQTHVKLLWTEAHLYLRFIAADQGAYLPQKGRDAELYRGDVVEAFIDPVGDGKQYVELQVNAANDVFDQLILLTAEPMSNALGRLDDRIVGRDFWAFPAWNMDGLKTAAKPRGSGEWIVDMAIPAKSLLRRKGVDRYAENMTLRANLVRYEWTTDAAGKRVLLAYNWSPVMHGCPHISPAAMGTLRLR